MLSDSDTKYGQMRSLGATAQEVYRQAIADGVDELGAWRVLRLVFGLSLVEAKEVMVQAKGLAAALSEHQQRLLDPLERELRRLPMDTSP
ncbi:MAG TPA: hypothetical protein VEL76_24615 [Gemmataceae bacterium]|nr:hypothetical protein [Gemmataceae bacterium]